MHRERERQIKRIRSVSFCFAYLFNIKDFEMFCLRLFNLTFFPFLFFRLLWLLRDTLTHHQQKKNDEIQNDIMLYSRFFSH
jgi:hypothetical protein